MQETSEEESVSSAVDSEALAGASMPMHFLVAIHCMREHELHRHVLPGKSRLGVASVQLPGRNTASWVQFYQNPSPRMTWKSLYILDSGMRASTCASCSQGPLRGCRPLQKREGTHLHNDFYISSIYASDMCRHAAPSYTLRCWAHTTPSLQCGRSACCAAQTRRPRIGGRRAQQSSGACRPCGARYNSCARAAAPAAAPARPITNLLGALPWPPLRKHPPQWCPLTATGSSRPEFKTPCLVRRFLFSMGLAGEIMYSAGLLWGFQIAL